MAYEITVCKDEARRAEIQGHPTLNGIDFLEVAPDQLTLRVFFLNSLPGGAYGIPAAPQHVRILGGVRITNIKVDSATHSDPNLLEIVLDQRGDFSPYTLIIDDIAQIDPLYGQVDFSFKADCPTRFDCKPNPCPQESDPDVAVDYLAKDYASFRRALLDFLSVRAPGWKEQHPADIGILLLELIAYVGDQLSYFQDAVSNEAFLETALQRISVRRHAGLVDYQMLDGTSARTFVFCAVTGSVTLLKNTQFLTRIDRRLGAVPPPHPALLTSVANEALAVAEAVFEPYDDATFKQALNAVEIYTWRNSRCCLPKGVTRADLTGDLTSLLKAGSYLLFEELTDSVLGPDPRVAGVFPDAPRPEANRDHRQIVRLTNVELGTDPIDGAAVTHVAWDEADAMRFPFCASSLLDSGPIPVGIARGNLVLCDHGRTREQNHTVQPHARAYRFALDEGPLSFRLPYDKGVPVALIENANPATAEPAVPDLSVATGSVTESGWRPVPSLLSTDAFGLFFVVETTNSGGAELRFGDGNYGQSVSDKDQIHLTYRTGVGTNGNVGQESLAHAIGPLGGIRTIRNPITAWSGTEAEAIPRVKEIAPTAFRLEQFRAVTEADYAAAAEKHPQVSHALAHFRWTGSWLTVFITVDPKSGVKYDGAFQDKILRWVTRYTLAGYDLEIRPPVYVALDLEIEVCVCLDHFRGDVEQAVRKALDKDHFFNPDRFTFGQPLYLSAVYAAVQAVPGVSSVAVRRFRRFDEDDPGPPGFRPATKANVDRGFIRIGSTEILRLDNDPSFPENGSLFLIMRGGK